MKENYWNQFMASGRIEDYLNYRLGDCAEEEEREKRGKEKRESDHTYRDGSFNHAHRRI